jgi:tRNA A-37 threonylcarbamoyl transferase component Bud32/DNA-directed RNA polymerase specialized sigma24 family protein
VDNRNAQDLIPGILSGDERATSDLYKLYVTRLIALAKSRISPKLAQRLDPEDIVQSAYRSFFLRARDNAFVIDDADGLWRLLATIVIKKLRLQARRHRAAKRSLSREVASPGEQDGDLTNELLDREPSVVDLTIAADELAWLLRRLEPLQQSAIHLRLQGDTIESIATTLSVNERTVRRWLTMAGELFAEREKDFIESPRSPPNTPAISLGAITARGLLLISPKDYVLERLIGSGGVSKVYVARHRKTAARFCIKVLRKKLRGQQTLCEWFLNEASLVAKLSHPCIVPIHGVGLLSDGGLFLVMKLIDGENLAERIADRGLPLEEAIAIVRQVAEVVDHAHRSGVLHCDLKPGNVLIDRENKIWLTDFGFGRLLNAENTRADKTGIAGTTGYMAPEQIDPGLAPLDTWTDVYGLGALLRTLVAGIPANDTAAEGPIPRINHLLTSCLKPSPPERISINEVINRLDQILQQT